MTFAYISFNTKTLSILAIVSSTNNDSFTLSFSVLMAFSSLAALITVYGLPLNRNEHSGLSRLAPDLSHYALIQC
jgi:hypothetical protein